MFSFFEYVSHVLFYSGFGRRNLILLLFLVLLMNGYHYLLSENQHFPNMLLRASITLFVYFFAGHFSSLFLLFVYSNIPLDNVQVSLLFVVVFKPEIFFGFTGVACESFTSIFFYLIYIDQRYFKIMRVCASLACVYKK